MATEIPIPTDPRFLDLRGERFGLLSVMTYAGYRSRRAAWNCLCDCGQVSIVTTSQLNSGKTRSCGCLRVTVVSARRRSHEHTINGHRTPEYRAWGQAKNRCTNPKCKSFKDYGARGITMCERWLASFEDFLADMGLRPSPLHSIDRFPNNDGNYEPSNCRWATRKEQNRNRRYRHSVTVNGQEMTLSEAAETAGLSNRLVNCRINKYGWSVEKALSEPKGAFTRIMAS